MPLFLKLLILVKRSTCFGRSFRLLSGTQDCTYSNRHTSNSCCYLLLAGMRWNAVPSHPRWRQLFDVCLLLYVQSWAPNDGRKDRAKHVERFTRINNLRNRCILLVLLQKYYDARTYERQMILKHLTTLTVSTNCMTYTPVTFQSPVSGCSTLLTPI